MADGTIENSRFADSRGRAEADCARLVWSFAYTVDHRQYEELVELFAEDGSFSRPDAAATGHAAILQLMHERPEDIVTRHLCGPPHFTGITAMTASAVTYVTIYKAHGVDGEPIKTKGAAGIAEFSDDFILTPDGWRIQRHAAAPVFIIES